ncbi:hypothetical protein [Cryobacterium sp. GrIS_2_6]|uniref:hypothetical protein n=1 Tax=Cryobacterium sp. GrIS_2_6 TaxID=3162785 RepID=UPI002DF8E978|nr:NADPH-dependent 2,4-dienoyl-CoA reductase/sulfur reductase-like enzyme [Cryobacterium psychrotolerans]
MNRIDIVYGGQQYSLGGRSAESVRNEINAAVTSGQPYWLPVNSGGGRFEDAYLLIAPGIAFAVLDVKPTNADDLDLEVDGAFNHDSL